MRTTNSVVLLLILSLSISNILFSQDTNFNKQEALLVPGLVLGLRHNQNQEQESGKYIALFTASNSTPVNKIFGGDRGASLHRGFEYWVVKDDPKTNPKDWKIPPGIVFGLRHSIENEKSGPTVFGRNVCKEPLNLTQDGFNAQFGGDFGAPKGQGYWWYESTGLGFSDWTIVEKLPKGTIVCLKHSKNQPKKTIKWKGKIYDPMSAKPAPSGFVRKFGGDIGAPSGQGFYWYEKIEGPKIVVQPELKVKLDRSILMGEGDNSTWDRDKDGLVDIIEPMLANAIRPLVVFDSAEKARRKENPVEPVTLFQVRPAVIRKDANPKTIFIKWVFVFKEDGGYGPNSNCGNSHKGDAEPALYALESVNDGITWTLSQIALADNYSWPNNSRLEVYDLMHPVIYMSAHKHHVYLTKDWDHKDSKYTSWYSRCNDDVDGNGCWILVDLKSIEADTAYYNNVGEFEDGCHQSPPFVNDLCKYFKHDLKNEAWGETFYGIKDQERVIRYKWLYTQIIK